jgi:hypothetical protein
VDEVEDAVAARIQPGDERRPRDGALRWDAGAKRREAAGLGEARQARQAARVDHLARQLVVQAVEAEDDDLAAEGG